MFGMGGGSGETISVAVQSAGVSEFESEMNAAAAATTNFKKKAALAGAGLAALAGGGLAVAVNEARKFQTAMVELEKVTNPETADAMSESINEMAKTIPLAQNALADIAADAGRFGIRGTENIEKFTESVAKMSTATDLSAQQAGESLAKLSTLTDTPVSKMENLGSSINALSNNFATSSQEIVDSMMRSAGAMAQFGLSQTEIAGFSAALNAVSESSERAGTRMRRLVQEISNPKKVHDMARALGMTVDQYKSMQENNPRKLLMQMVEGFKEGGSTANTLNKNLSTTSRQALAGLSQNLDGLNNALGLSSKAFKENTSLQKEFQTASKTLDSQLQLLMNNLRGIGITIGTALLPYVTSLVKSLNGAVTSFGNWVNAGNEMKVAIGAISIAVMGLLPGISLLLGKLTPLLAGFKSIAAIGISLVGTLGSVTTSAVGLGTALYGTLYTALTALPSTILAVGTVLKTSLVSGFVTVATSLIGLPAKITTLALSLGTTLTTAAISAVGALAAFPGVIAAKTAAMLSSVTISGLLSGALGVLSTAASIAAGGLTAVTAALATIAAPVTIAIAVIGALYVAWKKNFLGIKTITTNVFNLIKALLRGDMQTAKGIVGNGLNALRNIWNTRITPLIAKTKQVFNQIGSVIRGMLSWLHTNVVTPLLNRIRGVWAIHGDQLISEASQAWNSIMSVVGPILNKLFSLVNVTTNKVESVWSSHGDQILSVAKMIFDAIITTIEIALDAILTTIRVTLAIINGDWGKAWDLIKGLFERTLNSIVEFARGSFKSGMTAAFNLVIDAVKGIFEGLYNWLIGNSLIPDMLSDVISAVRGWNLSGAVDSVVSDAKSTLDGFSSKFKNSGKALMETFADGIKAAASAPKKATENAVDKVSDYIPSSDAKKGPLSNLTDSGKALLDTFAGGMEDGTDISSMMSTMLPDPNRVMNSVASGSGSTKTVREGDEYYIEIKANSRREGKEAGKGLKRELGSHNTHKRGY